MAEADALCDRLAIVDKGRIIVEGTPHDLKKEFMRRHSLEALPTLEDVFMEATGHSLGDDENDDGNGDGG
jgi:ABC-2 type transport system ATP-binding protein